MSYERVLHPFCILVARAVVNDDGRGGTALTLLSGLLVFTHKA